MGVWGAVNIQAPEMNVKRVWMDWLGDGPADYIDAA